jgi:GR25 family glycosyltransferase involved in LPS biosynthesis
MVKNIFTTLIILLFIIIIYIICLCSPKKEKFISPYKNCNINQTFYWINLEKSVERRINMNMIFDKHKIKNVRINAIQGEGSEKNKAIACTSSHILAINTFYESGDEIGIICEDDLIMEYKKYWRYHLDDVIEYAPNDWHIIQLAVIILPYLLPLFKNNKNLYIKYHRYISSTACYIINRKGAKKILHYNKLNNPTNHAENYIYINVNTYVFKYPMFTYPTENDSIIHNDHLNMHKQSKNCITNYLKYKD